MRKLLITLSSFVLLNATPLYAIEYFLRAAPTTVTMPDGEVVTMWGFAKDSSATVQDGTVTVLGPTLEVPPGDSILTIHLKNFLPSLNGQPTPVSIVIPGQITTMTPVRNPDGRLRSFTHETTTGATQVYNWTNMRPGTFIYQSGTHPALQVQMGLYGAVKKNFAPNTAYEGKSFDREVVLHYSEIDPLFHAAVATDNFGPGKAVTSTINYKPKYFLVNGRPYSTTTTPIFAGSVNQRILIRLLNSGLRTHVPVIQGTHVSAIAEDGRAYPYPFENYSLFLPAGKTLDTIWVPARRGRYPVYDRRLDQGMLSYLTVTF